MLESHHVHTTRPIPMAKSASRVFRNTGGNKRKSNTFSAHSVAGSGSSHENYADSTSDSRILYRMFSGPGGCSLFNCKYLQYICVILRWMGRLVARVTPATGIPVD